MKTKKVNRYYCDHCRKGLCHKPSMVNHEAICFRNPVRCCIMCGAPQESGYPSPTDVAANVAILERFGGDAQKLLVEIDCPACTLAAILQYSTKHKLDAEDYIHFDYKKERDVWYVERAYERAE